MNRTDMNKNDEDRTEILAELQRIFRDLLEEESLTLTEATEMDDVEAWDSVIHIQLIFEIETEFDIQFEAEKIAEMKTIKSIMDNIEECK